MTSASPSESSPTPEEKIIPLHASETWMRQFANRCKRELDLPALVHMQEEDFRKAATFFVNEYLVRKDARWDFPYGESGIAAMQQLIGQAFYFLADEQESVIKAAHMNQFMRHALYTYRMHVVGPVTIQSVDEYTERVVAATSGRLQDPADSQKRAAYFQELTELAIAEAPNILSYGRGKPQQLQNHLGFLIAKISTDLQKKGHAGLDDVTRNRLYTAMLVAVENVRQRTPHAFEGQSSETSSSDAERVLGEVRIALRKIDWKGQDGK